jgi:hypothetical protein
LRTRNREITVTKSGLLSSVKPKTGYPGRICESRL